MLSKAWRQSIPHSTLGHEVGVEKGALLHCSMIVHVQSVAF